MICFPTPIYRESPPISCRDSFLACILSVQAGRTHLIRHEVSSVHELLRLPPSRRALLHLLAKQIPGGKVNEPVLFDDELALRSKEGTGGQLRHRV